MSKIKLMAFLLTGIVPKHEQLPRAYFQHKYENGNHENLYVNINKMRGKNNNLDVDHKLELAAHTHAYNIRIRATCTDTGPHGETLNDRLEAVNFKAQKAQQIIMCGGNHVTRERELKRYKRVLNDMSYKYIGIGNSVYYYVIILAR